jgi:hypothetical protein
MNYMEEAHKAVGLYSLDHVGEVETAKASDNRDVRFWHKADIDSDAEHVRFRG